MKKASSRWHCEKCGYYTNDHYEFMHHECTTKKEYNTNGDDTKRRKQ